MFLSSLETFNYLTLWISSVVPPVLTLSWKLTRPKRQKVSFTTNGSTVQWKWRNKELSPYDSSVSILRNSNPLGKDYKDFQNLVNSDLTTDKAVAKLRMNRIPPTGAAKYSYLQRVWENNNMQCFSDFLKWYKNKHVVPTLEAMRKMIEFYHMKWIDVLKLGCTLPNWLVVLLLSLHVKL